MNAVAHVLAVFLGSFLYFLCAAWLYFRLRWHQRRLPRQTNQISVAAIPALITPWGLALLFVYVHGAVDDERGIPPRSLRLEQRLKERDATIRRLERELDIGTADTPTAATTTRTS